MIRLTLLLLVVILLQARRIRPSHHIIDDLKQYFGKMLGGNQGNTPQVAAPTNTAQEASNTNTFQNLINQVKGTNEPLTGNSIMSYFINKNGIGGGSAPSGPSGPSGQFDQSGPPQVNLAIDLRIMILAHLHHRPQLHHLRQIQAKTKCLMQ